MRKTNKIIMLLVLVFTVLLLSSCKKADVTPKRFIADVSPENLLVETFTDSKRFEAVNFYLVNATGQTTSTEVYKANEITFLFEDETEELTIDEVEAKGLEIKDAYAKNYVYELSKEYGKKKDLKTFNETLTITQVKKGSTFDYKVGYIKYLTFDKKGKLVSNGLVMNDSYIFTGKNLTFYEISTQTDVKEIDFNDLKFDKEFPEIDDLRDGKKWKNHELFDIEASTETVDFDFKVYLAATDKPLSVSTASFWNWIFLQIPIAFLMAFVSKIFGGSFAVGIIVTTIIVRTLAWPIYAKTNDMSMKMSVAQPDIDRLNRKYATRKDPESQQKMQMEMMALYKKHNINMFGCLLPILQMPIFFAMFQVVRRITIPGGDFYDKVTNTNFLGTDLAYGHFWAKLIFTALVGITMFALQKVSQTKPSYAKVTQESQKTEQAQQTEKTMKMVSYMMIIMMIFTAYASPNTSLALYWIIGNIFSIGQTLFNRYMNEKKYEKLQEEKLYGKSREIVDAKFKEKSGK